MPCLLETVTALRRQVAFSRLSGLVIAPVHRGWGHYLLAAVMDKAAPQLQVQRLLRAKDVATTLNISLALAYRLMQLGEIPVVKIGTAVRVRPDDLAEYIRANLSREL